MFDRLHKPYITAQKAPGKPLEAMFVYYEIDIYLLLITLIIFIFRI